MTPVRRPEYEEIKSWKILSAPQNKLHLTVVRKEKRKMLETWTAQNKGS